LMKPRPLSKPRHNLLYTSGSLSRLDFPGENPLS
jgi:hypothetical protein